jgi:translation initiation factor 5A
MGDDENEETFESADAGSSHTYPMEAGQIRKGGFIMIKGRPCKVSDVSTSKTGKHGHAKCHFVANDIFTGKKVEDLVPAGHTTSVPFVKKEEYQCIDVDEDDFVTLLTADGDTRSDIKLPRSLPPPEVPGAEELSQKICDLLKEEKDFYVIVQVACGTEQVMDIKVMTEAK